jgi:hypothetical protein
VRVVRKEFKDYSRVALALFIMVIAEAGLRAVAQELTDPELISRLNELTRKKGYKNVGIGIGLCQRLSIQSVGKDCAAYQAPYKDAEGTTHAFNTFNEPGTNILRIIFFKKTERDGIDSYLTAADGLLQRAVRKVEVRGEEVWTQIAKGEAATGFEAELVFWRTKLSRLEKESDREEADDRSCPKGQVREIISGRDGPVTRCVQR